MIIPTFDDVLAARKRISPYIHKTPVMTSSYLNGLCGAEIFFKCENLQNMEPKGSGQSLSLMLC